MEEVWVEIGDGLFYECDKSRNRRVVQEHALLIIAGYTLNGLLCCLYVG